MRLPRRARICSLGSRRRSRETAASERKTAPPTCACGGSRRMMASDVTDLPDPDSPTSPRTSPGAVLKLRSRTANSNSGGVPFADFPEGNPTVKFRISRREDTKFIVAGVQPPTSCTASRSCCTAHTISSFVITAGGAINRWSPRVPSAHP